MTTIITSAKKWPERINNKKLESELYNDMVTAIEGVFTKYGVSFDSSFLSELLPIPADLDITVNPKKK